MSIRIKDLPKILLAVGKILLVSIIVVCNTNIIKGCTHIEDELKYDVVVVGATPAGVSAAVNAAKEGASVALLQKNMHIGGLASGGLSNPDFKSFESLGGTFLEVMERVEQYYIDTYGPDSKQVINSVKGAYAEPRVARMVFENMLDEANVNVFLRHRLDSVTVNEVSGHRRITKASFLNRESGNKLSIAARIFVDGTYEGDLMAAAGVPYRIGREGKDEYDEKLAPSKADSLVQAYNFRVVLTTDSTNQIPITRPANYDRQSYALLVNYIHNNDINTIDDISRYLLRVRRMPNDKAEFNDVRTAPLSLSRTNINNSWPEGDYALRADIFQQYKEWSMGLIYFLQNDPEIPAKVRNVMQQWALPADEFVDTNNWPPALYVREGRRMVGSYVFTEHDTNLEPNSVRSLQQDRAVAISDYSINTHGVLRPSGGEHVGVIGRSVRPMQIPYDIMLPSETNGLLVPVAVSASHVGFAALRYEPLWTALGQAAGIAASQAIKKDILVRNIEIRKLQLRVHELGAKTIYVSDLGEPTEVPRPTWEQPSKDFQIWLTKVPPASPFFRPVQYFGTLGFFHELINPETVDDWSRGGSTGQWSLRMPHHEVEPDRMIDEELAINWLNKARDLEIQPSITVKEVIDQGMSRGELLQVLFNDSITDVGSDK